jgi:hypothetical protein
MYLILIANKTKKQTNKHISTNRNFSETRTYYVYKDDSQSVRRPVWPQVTIWDLRPIYLSPRKISYIYGFFTMGRPLWREDASVIYSHVCYWALPVLSLSRPSTAGFDTISWALNWECVPFCRILRLVGLWWKHSEKFWEELIAYFPFIRNVPHRKQHLKTVLLLRAYSLPR